MKRETKTTDKVDSISFADKFSEYQDKYDSFLRWCMDNNNCRTVNEWNTVKSIEFKKRGLDRFFD